MSLFGASSLPPPNRFNITGWQKIKAFLFKTEEARVAYKENFNRIIPKLKFDKNLEHDLYIDAKTTIDQLKSREDIERAIDVLADLLMDAGRGHATPQIEDLKGQKIEITEKLHKANALNTLFHQQITELKNINHTLKTNLVKTGKNDKGQIKHLEHQLTQARSALQDTEQAQLRLNEQYQEVNNQFNELKNSSESAKINFGEEIKLLIRERELLDSNMQELENLNTQLKEKVELAQKQVVDLTVQNISLNEKLIASKEATDTIGKEITELQSFFSKIQESDKSKIDILEGLLNSAKEIIKNGEDNIQILKRTNQDLNKDINQLSIQLKNSDEANTEEKQKLTNAINIIIDQKTEIEKILNELQDQNGILTKQVTESEEKYNFIFREKEKLQADFNKVTGEVQALTINSDAHIKELQTQNQTLQTNLSKTTKDTQNKIDHLQNDLIQAKDTLNETEQKRLELEKKIQEVETTASELQRKNSEGEVQFNTEIETLKKIKETLTSKIADLENFNEKLSKQVEITKKEVIELTNQNVNLNEQLIEAKNTTEAINKEIKSLQTVTDELKKSDQIQIDELENKLKLANQTVEVGNIQIGVLEKAADNLTEDIHQLNIRLKSMEEANATEKEKLISEINLIKNQKSELDGMIVNLKQENERLTTQISTSQQQHATLLNEHAELKDAYSKLEKEIKSLQTKSTQEIVELKKINQTLQASLEEVRKNADDKIVGLESIVSDLEIKLNIEFLSSSKISKQSAELQLEIEKLQQALSAEKKNHMDDNDRNEKRILDLEKQIAQLSEAYKTLQDQTKTAISEINTFQNSLTDMGYVVSEIENTASEKSKQKHSALFGKFKSLKKAAKVILDATMKELSQALAQAAATGAHA